MTFDISAPLRYTPGMTINVPITPPLEELLREQLATGHFQNASDVVSAALRLMDERPPASSPSTLETAFGIWSGRETDGLAYQRALRAEWGQ